MQTKKLILSNYLAFPVINISTDNMGSPRRAQRDQVFSHLTKRVQLNIKHWFSG